MEKKHLQPLPPIEQYRERYACLFTPYAVDCFNYIDSDDLEQTSQTRQTRQTSQKINYKGLKQ